MFRRRFLKGALAGLAAGPGRVAPALGRQRTGNSGASAAPAIQLSSSHLAAVNRRRRVAKNFDVLLVDPDRYESVDALLKHRFSFIDDPGSCIDSVWWNWGEGNVVPYPSKFLPTYNQPGFRRWLREGVDIVRIFQDETRRRGLEVFFSHRMNGSDNDPQYIPGRGSFVDDMSRQNPIPLKRQHPDWLLPAPWNPNGYWNYAVPGVRDYVFRKLQEVAEEYEFDGIELDFARMSLLFPEGRAWENRSHMTSLIRRLRLMTLRVERRRGRPFLLAARVPENLMGCHFDGLDVETWIREQLLDLVVLGCRNFQVDLPAFRAVVGDQPVKLLCSLDEHHASDGYAAAPIEVLRGVWSNWHHQGADGFQSFNFKYAPDPGELHWPNHRQSFREMGEPGRLRFLDKTFVVQRRGGGHGPSVIPDPHEWTTPTLFYFNTNLMAPLPAPLDNAGRTATLLTLYVGDDVPGASERVSRLRLRLLLNDPETAKTTESEKIAPVLVRDTIVPKRVGGPGPAPIRTSPPVRGIEHGLHVRLNNLPLGPGEVRSGWLEYPVRPDQLARGENLVDIRVAGRATGCVSPILVEKLELEVKYG